MGSSADESSVMMTSVSTRPRVIEPPFSRRSTSALLILDEFVDGRSMITGCSPAHGRWSWPPPGASVAGHHGIRARRTPGAGAVLLGLGSRSGPMLLDRVEDLPGQLDL